ncbi:MAG TPA: NAD(P)-dependent oxidoreductase [Candidatus Dormibacteraeota bacterium]
MSTKAASHSTVAITGAAGGVGSVLARGLRRDLRLLDIRPAPGCEVLDVRDLAAVEAAFQGIAAVIHLGAIPTEAPFEDILEHNLRGTHNVLEAARRCGVKRVVFASSNHVTGMYGRSDRIGPEAPIRPDTYYGVSKAFGEALGRLYAEKWGVSVVCIRIGTCIERPLDRRHLSTWLSPNDAVALFSAALDAPVQFSIVYGISANTRGWWDLASARALGYRPRDNAEAFADEVAEDRSEPFDTQGGAFTAPAFAGERA